MDSLSRRIERLEAQAGVSQRIELFEELMAYMHEVFDALKKGISVDSLPVKTFEGSARSWALGLAQELEQRLMTGEELSVAELVWLLPAYNDRELRGLLPARVRREIEEFLRLSREGRLRYVETEVLGGELQVVSEIS